MPRRRGNFRKGDCFLSAMFMRDNIIKSAVSKTDVFDFHSETSPQNKCNFEALMKCYRNKGWAFSVSLK